MHRVVTLTSKCKTQTFADNAKSFMETKIQDYATNQHEAYNFIDDNKSLVNRWEVNTGTDEEGNPTLAVLVDFNDATDANNGFDWLKSKVQENSTEFISCRLRVHDCYHAAGENLPCKIGDIFEL